MLHDAKFERKEKSLNIRASLHLNREEIKSLNLKGAVVSASLADGGANPGPDAEVRISITVPYKK